jgi:hypothetical protein
VEGGRLVSRTLRTFADGIPAMQSATELTLELALCPFLFPHGRGYYQHGMPGLRTLNEYLWLRMHQLFSPFTLFKLYLVHMWQIKQCCNMSQKVSLLASWHHLPAMLCFNHHSNAILHYQ